ncbi:PREDICTED: CTD small phosphatase-like protein 2 [Eufriesea mexicana]|uniref:CTD small phosphatase-like protein 2 n=1 Tax=Eufriesea mexicana TaxID=516756 RepID=UPI00083C24D4|nr:PREDICTED: CTD small phosphatase-like protein 2 [Eufriesea mexicana]
MSKEENSEEVPQEGTTGSNEAPKKDTGADIYENRGTKKIIRLITVLAYMFSVSFVAIVLSAYYLFLWEPPNPRLLRRPVQLSAEPEIQFLLSDQMTIQDDAAKDFNTSYISFSNHISGPEDLANDYNQAKDHREKLNESLFLLRNSLIELLQNKINNSKSFTRNSSGENWKASNFLNYTSLETERTLNSTKKSSERDSRHSSKIMNLILDNNGTSQTLESSNISGSEENNDHFTSIRNHSMYEPPQDIPRLNHNSTENVIVNKKQYNKSISSNFQTKAGTLNEESVKVKTPRYSKMHSSDEEFMNTTITVMTISDKVNLDIQKSREDRAHDSNNVKEKIDLNDQSTIDFGNLGYASRLGYPEQPMQSPVKLANVALKFKETQIERMTTKSMTIANEQSPVSEIITTPQQKDLLTILTEIVETSSNATPLTTSEDLQTSLSTETKEISTKMHSKIN